MSVNTVRKHVCSLHPLNELLLGDNHPAADFQHWEVTFVHQLVAAGRRDKKAENRSNISPAIFSPPVSDGVVAFPYPAPNLLYGYLFCATLSISGGVGK